MIIFDEKKRAKEVLLGIAQDIKNTYQIISLLTRYNKQVLNLNDEENYNFMSQWLGVHLEVYSEYKYTQLITDMVRHAGDKPFYLIQAIEFYEDEIDSIKALNDLKLEKLAFILLYLSKYQAVIYGYDNRFISCKPSEMCKLARLNVSLEQRQKTIYRLTQMGYIHHPQKVDSSGFFVDIEHNPESPIMFKVTDVDANDPVYAYLKFAKGQKIMRCKSCGKWVRHNDIGTCNDCRDDKPKIKTLKCIECGTEFQTSMKNNKTQRCELCQHEHDKRLGVMRIRNYRQRNK